MTQNHELSRSWTLIFAAWLIALVSTLGVLFIGEVMGQTPCSLCWYQRIFMFPLAIILGLAAWRNDGGVWLYALPLSVLGGLIAAYHTLLFSKIIPEPITPCTASGPSCSGQDMLVFGVVPLPLLSLIAFTLIAVLMLARRRYNHD